MFGSVELLARNLQLGEGPVWHAQTQSLWFVDITRNAVMMLDTATQRIQTIQTADMVGCVVPANDGTILAAVKHKLIAIDPVAGTQTVQCALDLPDDIRFNDGKCDAYGRLWVGTMAVNQAHPKAKCCGKLYCIENGTVLAQYEGFTIANGMAWSADGKIFYHVDTPTQKIDAYDVDAQGLLQNRRTAVVFDPSEGAPDGMCIDTHGNLWIAMWGGGQVLCVNPADGKRLHRLVVQHQNVSCCAFGGSDLRTLFITTAQDEKGHGGSVFAVQTQAQGTKTFQYGG